MTDICTKHFYWDAERLPKDYNEELEMNYPEDGYPSIYIKPYGYKNEPIIYSEVGGYTLDLYNKVEKHFGYGKVDSSKELLEKVIFLCKEFDKRKKWIHGFCYTELYDQFQEINGLLTINREPKFTPELLKKEIDKLFY
ncbi:MAG: hypothetical protein EU548_04515 [Promethearchaeota archaeon]|nr:MAG: hypothetical protein EU548_04515 [Candidatus Lokiarchaeota archaeon]